MTRPVTSVPDSLGSTPTIRPCSAEEAGSLSAGQALSRLNQPSLPFQMGENAAHHGRGDRKLPLAGVDAAESVADSFKF